MLKFSISTVSKHSFLFHVSSLFRQPWYKKKKNLQSPVNRRRNIEINVYLSNSAVWCKSVYCERGPPAVTMPSTLWMRPASSLLIAEACQPAASIGSISQLRVFLNNGDNTQPLNGVVPLSQLPWVELLLLHSWLQRRFHFWGSTWMSNVSLQLQLYPLKVRCTCKIQHKWYMCRWYKYY